MHDVETLKSQDDEQTRRAKERVGTTVRGRWHLDSLIGVGGMAAVYAATHRNTKRVAVKMLHPELSANAEVKQRFIDEGYAANRVGHAGAVSVLDDDVAEDGSVFLVMDLLEGETLDNRIRRHGRLEPQEVLLIVDGLLDVLAAAHDKGIVHRDVKPDNIFITTEGKVKLLDFGIARVAEPGRPRTTQSGATLGTPAFMPPEQARGRWEQLDGRTDIYAVGATIFVALTGRYVHTGETVNEELLSAMTQRAPSMRESIPDLSNPLVDFIDKALAFEQENRWSDARTMQAAARTVQAIIAEDPAAFIIHEAHSPTHPPVDSAPPVTLLTPHPIIARTPGTGTVPSRKSVKRPIIVTGAAAGLTLVLALAISQSRSSKPSETPSKATVSAAGGTPVGTTTQPVDPPAPPAAPALPAPEPQEVAPAQTAKAKVDRPVPVKLQRAPATKPATSAQVVAPPAPANAQPPAQPTVVDPLDRRR